MLPPSDIIGIGYWPTAVCGPTVDAIVAAILHVRDVAGMDHVALGSDFDGAVTTGFDATSLQAIATGLLHSGLNEADVTKVMGGNARWVLLEGALGERGGRDATAMRTSAVGER